MPVGAIGSATVAAGTGSCSGGGGGGGGPNGGNASL